MIDLATATVVCCGVVAGGSRREYRVSGLARVLFLDPLPCRKKATVGYRQENLLRAMMALAPHPHAVCNSESVVKKRDGLQHMHRRQYLSDRGLPIGGEPRSGQVWLRRPCYISPHI